MWNDSKTTEAYFSYIIVQDGYSFLKGEFSIWNNAKTQGTFHVVPLFFSKAAIQLLGRERETGPGSGTQCSLLLSTGEIESHDHTISYKDITVFLRLATSQQYIKRTDFSGQPSLLQ